MIESTEWKTRLTAHDFARYINHCWHVEKMDVQQVNGPRMEYEMMWQYYGNQLVNEPSHIISHLPNIDFGISSALLSLFDHLFIILHIFFNSCFMVYCGTTFFFLSLVIHC